MPEPFRRARRAYAIRGLLESFGPPGEETERKREVLAAAKRLLRDDHGGPPAWVERLLAELEEGRL